MESTGNYTIVIGAAQKTGQKSNSVIDIAYKGYIRCLVVLQYLVMPHARHVCMLLPLLRPHVGHVYMLLPLVMPHVGYTHLSL